MKKISFFALFFLGFIALAVSQTADEIIAKNIAVTGGSEKLKQLMTTQMEGKITLGPGMEAPFTMYAIHGKAAKFELTFQGMTMVQCIEGETGWGIMPFQGKKDAEPFTPEQIKAMADQMDIQGILFDYAAKGHAIELLGKEDLEGTEVFKIKVTKKNGDLVYKYIDAESFLELKTSTTVKMNDAETKSDMLSSNYKMVEGINMPFSLINRNTIAGQTFDQSFTIEKIIINPAINLDIFKMPKK